jgi:hypothetical protein
MSFVINLRLILISSNETDPVADQSFGRDRIDQSFSAFTQLVLLLFSFVNLVSQD